MAPFSSLSGGDARRLPLHVIRKRTRTVHASCSGRRVFVLESVVEQAEDRGNVSFGNRLKVKEGRVAAL